MIYKCKMCGGELDILGKENVCECPYCGTTQTIPNVDKEKILRLYNRATHFLKLSEYDKASTIYEQIIQEEGEQAEAYWGLCLCKYGIEYVDDPKANAKVATCHRTLTTSILKDSDYLKAIELSDVVAKELYKKEAKYINTVQKKILEVSKTEEPYDIFICYKETDEKGNRTIDSVIAEEIYDELLEKEYRVFFAKISLEDKLGQDYEPFIFAALTSAKVMLVIGSKEEYFQAPWVKNEWSRFLKLKDSGKKKYLIPCYKEVSPYEMPEEFINLQAQDLNKIGYLQDLTKGIDKLVGKKKKTLEKSVVVEEKRHDILASINSLMKEKKFDEADKKCDELLILNSKDAQAYYLKHLIDCKITEFDFVHFLDESCSLILYRDYNLDKLLKAHSDLNYNNAVEYADAEYAKYLQRHLDWLPEIKEMINNRNIREKYNKAKEMKKTAKTLDEYRELIALFDELGDYEDSKKQAEFYKKKIFKDDFNDFIYDSLVECIRPMMSQEEKEFILSGFEKLGDYRDSKNYVLDFNKKKLRTQKELNDELSFLNNKKDSILENHYGLIELKESSENLKKQKEMEISNLKEEYSKNIDKLNELIESMKTEIIDNTNRITTLGIFAFKEKKELRERLDRLTNELSATRKEKNQKEEEIESIIDSKTKEINEKYNLALENLELEKNNIMQTDPEISTILNKIRNAEEELDKINSGVVEENLWDCKLMTMICDSLGYYIVRFVLGKYPNRKVTSEAVIYELSKLTPNNKGVYKYYGLEFVKQNGQFYVVLPIEWRCIKSKALKHLVSKNNTNRVAINHFLLCTRYYIDFRKSFKDEDLYEDGGQFKLKKTKENACNYSLSDVRNWLNNQLYEDWFNDLEKEHIQTVLISNKPETTSDEINEFCCEDTIDKIFLPCSNFLSKSVFGREKNLYTATTITQEEINKENEEIKNMFLECNINIEELPIASYIIPAEMNFATEQIQKILDNGGALYDFQEEQLREDVYSKAYSESEYLTGKFGTDYTRYVLNNMELKKDFHLTAGQECYNYNINGESRLYFYHSDGMMTRSPNKEGNFFEYVYADEGYIDTERNHSNDCLPIRPFMIFSDNPLVTDEVDDDIPDIFKC